MSEQSFGNVDRISYCLSLIDLHLILPETAGFARVHCPNYVCWIYFFCQFVLSKAVNGVKATEGEGG